MKYSSRQIVYNNILFDSESEMLYYKEIESDLNITNIQVHRSFVLIKPFEYEGKQIKAVEYTPDFFYYNKSEDRWYVVEIKGIPTRDYELRVKLFKSIYGYYHFVEIAYSKALGFKESHEHKKEMKTLRTQKAIDKAFQLANERKERTERLRAKYQSRVDLLNSKSKLSSNDLKSLEMNKRKLEELK